jgi:hypothetical protein
MLVVPRRARLLRGTARPGYDTTVADDVGARDSPL